jgi:hypothetical protein
MITSDTAAQLSDLGKKIYDVETSTGLIGPDPTVDAQLAALIKEPMQTIDGRAFGDFKFTLNVTCALMLRPRHWFIISLDELYNQPAKAGASFGLINQQTLQPVAYVYGWGNSMALATCAGICFAWSEIITMWLSGNYSLAVSQPQ